MSLKERIQAIADECHGGFGGKTLEINKAERLVKELCGILADQENRLCALESQSAAAAADKSDEPGPDEPGSDRPGPDQVESRRRSESDVTRRRRPA
jgi:hypothetical protein